MTKKVSRPFAAKPPAKARRKAVKSKGQGDFDRAVDLAMDTSNPTPLEIEELAEQVVEGEQGSNPTPQSSPDMPNTNTRTESAHPSASAGQTGSSPRSSAVAAGASTAKPPGKLAARIDAAKRASEQQVALPTVTYPPGLTDEQVAILDVARMIEVAKSSGQRVLVICAGAGTGKTFTLRQLEQVLSGTGQYTAFNKSLVEDSRPKFKRAAVNTTHSLAFGPCGRRFNHRLNSPRIKSYQVAKVLGIVDFVVELPADVAPAKEDGTPRQSNPLGVPATKKLSASYLAGQVMVAVKRFCQSADRELGPEHFRGFANLDAKGSTENSDRVRDYLLPFAEAAWADLSSESGALPFGHDVYVKIWQLEGPVIGAQYILLDEYQDTAPVFLDCLMQQEHALLILVGDDNQRIYEWRGAVNAGDYFPDAPRRLLSQSWRFGQAVADVANSVLALLEKPTDLKMRGSPTIPSRVCEVKEPKCWLYRTNAGAIGRLMGLRELGKRGHLIGKVDDVVDFCKAALDLQAGRPTTHPELGCFESWKEVQVYAKEDEGADLRLMVRLIDKFKASEIVRALRDMPDESKADVVLATVHRSKGREWPTVKLGGDFPTANRLKDEDLRLLYVAATRAQEELDLTACPTFCGGYDRSAGSVLEEGGEDTWVPGIEVTYSATMPTPEELGTYREVRAAQPPETPTVVQTKVPEGANTWAKGRNEDWLVRGKPGQVGTVAVYKRDGTKQEQTIKRCVWQGPDAALYEV